MRIFSGSDYYESLNSCLADLWRLSSEAPSDPVQLVHFTARKQSPHTVISWSTPPEQNNCHFIVQRSFNGSSFDSIGVVAASGKNAQTSNYSFTDYHPDGRGNFYRLKQVDQNGINLHSDIVNVVMRQYVRDWSIVPNSIQDVLNLRFTMGRFRKLKLVFTDISGHIMQYEERLFPKGSTLLTMPVCQLTAGTYYLTIYSDNQSETKTFLKKQ